MNFLRLVLIPSLLTVSTLLFSQTLAIKNVAVIPMDPEIVLESQTVLIKDELITAVGKDLPVPVTYTVIDGTGKYLIPGLWDMHAHFFYEQGRNVNTCELELKMMLANGLTTARIECGDSVYLDARSRVKSGQWVGPHLIVASPQVVGAWPWPPPVFAYICKTPADAEKAVRKAKADGYDEIKITFMVKRDVYDAIIRTAKEQQLKVTGHVGPLVKLPTALAAKEQIEHMDEFIDMLLPDTSYNHGQSVSDMNIWRKKAWETVPYLDESKMPALVEQVRKAGIFVTPTNYFFFSSFGEQISAEAYRQRPDYNYIPLVIKEDRWSIRDRYWNAAPPEASRKKYIAIRQRMTRDLWKAGVPLMAGSDSPEWFIVTGFSIHDELATFVEAGLTPFAALQTATVNPARYEQVHRTEGGIAKGNQADLILLDANPLIDIRNTRRINSVISRGKWYDRSALDQFLAEARQLGN